ncbi:MAG: cytochrome c oxidase assembly protein [Actinomycetota bacterium]
MNPAGLVGWLAAGGPTEVPPPLTVGRLLTAWSPEPAPLLLLLALAGLYLAGVRRLRRRGAAWSWWRVVSFVGLGLGSAAVATLSALDTYALALFSVHMVQHVVLSMLTPVFLALGAPITLALRTLSGRPRRLLLAAVHSPVARVLTFPVVAGALFVATPFALYLTSWYEATLRNPWLHDLSHLHVVLVGALWFWPMLGLDPLPARPPYPLRLLAVLVTLPLHAWLGIAIMSGTTVLAADWYAELGRTWGASPLADQRTAGGIMWASGDLVALLLLAVLFAQWSRAAQREAEREDRRLDRLEAEALRRAGPAG